MIEKDFDNRLKFFFAMLLAIAVFVAQPSVASDEPIPETAPAEAEIAGDGDWPFQETKEGSPTFRLVKLAITNVCIDESSGAEIVSMLNTISVSSSKTEKTVVEAELIDSLSHQSLTDKCSCAEAGLRESNRLKFTTSVLNIIVEDCK